jgi:molybdate/tungstate transport system substrate-binding protein
MPSINARRCATALSAIAVSALAVGCGSSSKTTSTKAGTTAKTTTTSTPAAKPSGDVDVLSAGSLDTVMTKDVGPAFHAATGYTLVDTSMGSSALAADIKNKVDRADVFVSASPTVTATLMGASNGNWVSWYGTFASSPVVLGYYPKSKFATDLKTKPWYDVITMPGFRLGRTDPSQDPGGVLAAKALAETAKAKNLPALAKLGTETSDEYAEDPEEANILSGQLDAAFMYEADANSQSSPFVPLTGVNLAGDYTITLLKNAPHVAAAEAFIKFLLSSAGQAELRADHFTIVSPAKVTGTGVPSVLKSVLGS